MKLYYINEIGDKNYDTDMNADDIDEAV